MVGYASGGRSARCAEQERAGIAEWVTREQPPAEDFVVAGPLRQGDVLRAGSELPPQVGKERQADAGSGFGVSII